MLLGWLLGLGAACSAVDGDGCRPGESRCEGKLRQVCLANGTWKQPERCPVAGRDCVAGSCGDDQCQPPAIQCVDQYKYVSCEVNRVWGSQEIPCGSGLACQENECRVIVCDAHVARCEPNDRTHRLVCNGYGTAEVREACAADRRCYGGDCVPFERCRTGETVCSGLYVSHCQENGEFGAPEPCPQGESCRDGACVATCREGEVRCHDHFATVACIEGQLQPPSPCDTGQVCVEQTGTDGRPRGRCEPGLCRADRTKTCGVDGEGKSGIRTCDATGADFAPAVACPEGQGCIEPLRGLAECSALMCVPGQTICTDDGKVARCRPDGTAYRLPEACVTGLCDPRVGACRPLVCEPGSQGCFDNEVRACDRFGTGFMGTAIKTCNSAAGEECWGGECVSACAKAESTFSYLGCRYGLVDLENAVEGQGQLTFAVVVSNPDPIRTALVTITRPNARGPGTPQGGRVCSGERPSDCPSRGALKDVEVPPNSLVILKPGDSTGPVGTTAGYFGLLLTSTLPVAVYQFNPLDNAGDIPGQSGGSSPYSNDASTLFPLHTWQREYVNMTYHRNQSGATFTGTSTLTVMAGEDAVVLEITLPPGSGSAQGGEFGPQTAGQTFNVELQPYQVFNLKGQMPPENGEGESYSTIGDLTGARVRCAPGHGCGAFAVWGGHVCALIPAGQGYCDHIEDQIPPVVTWGREVMLVPMLPPGDVNYPKNRDIVRIYALEDNTILTWLPEKPTSNAPQRLAAGEWANVSLRQPVLLQANGPILVGHFMTGATNRGVRCDACNALGTDRPGGVDCDFEYYVNNCKGDPAFAVAVPTEQYRKEYVFLTPGTYANNELLIFAPRGAGAELNGQLIPDAEFSPLGGDWVYVRKPLGPTFRTHRLRSAMPGTRVGIVVFGYSQDVSYAYPGGMDLTVIQSR